MPYRDNKKVAAGLKKIYTALDREHAERELERFAAIWAERYPMSSALWSGQRERIVPFLGVPARRPPGASTIEAFNRQIRKMIKTRGSFPTRTPDASCSPLLSPTPSASGATPYD